MAENVIRTLGDGLVLRHATPQDEKALVAFNRRIHGEGEWDEKGLEDWTRDLLRGGSPTFKAGDVTVVESSATKEILSTCCLISQTWSYEGLPFKVGRPELVGTDPGFRRRGLVRQQFEVLHEWSAQRGELVQVITGIPYYYRQFGYEMALSLSGGRAGYANHVPELKEGEEDPYTFRLATEADLPFVKSAYERGCQRDLVAALRDEAEWRYELTGKSPYNINRREIYVIEDRAEKPVGMLGIPPLKWGHSMMLDLYELAPGAAWTAVTPSVIRFLWQKGEDLAREQGQTQTIFGFWLGESHPAYEVIPTKMPREQKPYAFYVRVPDLPAFLQTIRPVLEKRLAASAFAGYTGELKLSFYRDGLRLDIKDGEIGAIQTLSQENLNGCAAHFPPLVFLQLVFGYRSVPELRHSFADCSTRDLETANLLEALFPKKPSHVWPIS